VSQYAWIIYEPSLRLARGVATSPNGLLVMENKSTLKICIVSEAIRSPFDEGVRVFVYNLIKELAKNCKVLGIGRSNNFKSEIESVCEKVLPENRLFLSWHLRQRIKEFKPDVIYYAPTAHATLYSFIRAQFLKIYGNGAKTILITLQPRQYSFVKRKIMPFIAPDLVLAQSEKTLKALDSLGCSVRKIWAGVDLERFTAASEDRKKKLREKYGIPRDKYVILHVGHINKNRNMQFMEKIQLLGGSQAVVVGSTTYPADVELVRNLEKKGVIIITGYIEKIEEVYQCANCYIFPVFSEGACIEVPLSILEAMACNLPVVTTQFGGIPSLIDEGNGFIYVNNEEEIIPKIVAVKNISEPETRKAVKQYSWSNVVKQVLIESGIQRKE